MKTFNYINKKRRVGENSTPSNMFKHSPTMEEGASNANSKVPSYIIDIIMSQLWKKMSVWDLAGFWLRVSNVQKNESRVF